MNAQVVLNLLITKDLLFCRGVLTCGGFRQHMLNIDLTKTSYVQAEGSRTNIQIERFGSFNKI